MPLKPKAPGTNILGAFSSGLNEGADLGEEFTPNSSYHLPSYALSLKDLSNLGPGQNIDSAAREFAWQCVAVSKNGKVVIGEVTPRSKGARQPGHLFDGPVRMTSLSHGQIIDGIFSTVLDLAKIATDLVQEFHLIDDYEPRMLRIPGLLVTAIWLKSQTASGTDWVVPLHTHVADLRAQKMFAMQDFLNIMRREAEARLAHPVFD